VSLAERLKIIEEKTRCESITKKESILKTLKNKKYIVDDVTYDDVVKRFSRQKHLDASAKAVIEDARNSLGSNSVEEVMRVIVEQDCSDFKKLSEWSTTTCMLYRRIGGEVWKEFLTRAYEHGTKENL
jgi:hypothetical protein